MEKIRIFDLHCDTLDRLALYDCSAAQCCEYHQDAPRNRMTSLYDNDGHISLNRLQDYQWCQCFAAFIPDTLTICESWDAYNTVRVFLEGQADCYPGQLSRIYDARSIEDALRDKTCAALFTVEGGSFLAPQAGCGEERIEQIAHDGVKMLTLTWNAPNALGSGHDTCDGLTPFGRRMVRALENQRIVVDVSHLNDEGFKEVASMAQRPFAASHSNARSVCGHLRNLTDEQFRTIVSCEGIVGLNYYIDFISDCHAQPTRDDILRHVDHFLSLGGERTLALGSDYDGSDVPDWLCPAEKVRTLYELLGAEFGQELADDICFNNAHRFFVRNEVL